MKYLTNAVNFSIKNWMLILPVFVLSAIVNLISRAATPSLSTITALMNPNNITDPTALLAPLTSMMGAAAGAGIVAFIATLIYSPATYGLVNKGLETGSAGLNDLGSAISSNFAKFIMYIVGTIVLGLGLSIAAIIVIFLLGLLLGLLGTVGNVLMFIIMLAVAVFFIALVVLLSMWFAAMVVDGLSVVDAAKKSIEVVKGCFWTVLGITVLVYILFAIAGFILGLLRVIPLLGPIIYSVVPAGQFFVMAVFLLMVYRDKTGRASAV